MGKQPTMGQKKSKDAIARAAASSRKGTKKKWSKKQDKAKLNYAVWVTKAQLNDIEKEVPKMKLVTLKTLSERFKVIASISRQILRYCAEKKLILPLDFQHH